MLHPMPIRPSFSRVSLVTPLFAVGRAWCMAWSMGCALLVISPILWEMPAYSQSQAEIPSSVLQGLKSAQPRVRIAALVAVAKLKHPNSRALIEEKLGDSDNTVRAAAVDALGQLGDPAALASIRPLVNDSDALVKSTADSTIKLLDKIRLEQEKSKSLAQNPSSGANATPVVIPAGSVGVHMDATTDLSGRNFAGLTNQLTTLFSKNVQTKGGNKYVLTEGKLDKGFGVALKIRKITTNNGSSESFVDVKCDMTVTELPGNALRLAANANASVGIEGSLDPATELDLANDGVKECAPSLAQDFVEYMKKKGY